MRKDVLLFARSREPHATALEREFHRRKRTVVRVNPASFPYSRRLSLSVGPEEGPTTYFDYDALAQVGVGWLGASRAVRLPAMQTGARRFARLAALQGIDSFVRALGVPWVNDYLTALRSDDKFHQLLVAKQLGFQIPDTLFTNDPERFARFVKKHVDVIAKSASGSAGLPGDRRILTQRLGPRALRDAAAVRLAPVMFQPYIPKSTELRVTVIGDEAFPVRIHSQDSPRTRTDWRRYVPGMRYEKARLPRALLTRCVKLAHELRLGYGGIDLIETPAGEHVFLEINSLPAWLWLEDATKIPFTATLADHLERQIGRRAAS